MASLNSQSNATDQLNIATMLAINFTTSVFTFNSQPYIASAMLATISDDQFIDANLVKLLNQWQA
jgi:hypothetical protein